MRPDFSTVDSAIMTSELTLTPAEQCLAVEQIKRTFAARLRCMDNKEWHLYPTFHTDDVVSLTFGDHSVVGADAVTTSIKRVLDGRFPITSVHHGHTPEIELTSDTTARGVWAMEDHLWWTNGDQEEHLHGYGHYHEEYRRENGRWLISRRALTRLRVDTTPQFYERGEPAPQN